VNVVDVGYSSTNYYVLGPDHARLLVDCGMPGSYGKLRARLRRMDVAIEHIGYLLVTHFHPDHAGIAQELKNDGVRMLLLDVQRKAVPRLNALMARHGPHLPIRLDDNMDLRLEDSRAFLAGVGVAGQIVHTPGHSDDSVTLVLDSGEAFTGDLTLPDLAPDADAAAVAASWRRLRDLGARTAYPGHGPPRLVSHQAV
jgi:ribonuclease/clavin/mitogillin